MKTTSLLGVKLAESTSPGEVVNFDVKAMMEEKERRSGHISVGYSLKVGTKPNVAKYEVEGVAALEGKDEDIKAMLEVNPETQIPFVFQRVYQHVFMSIYLLATIIDAPYPPSNLLPMSQPTPTVQMDTKVAAPAKEEAQLPASTSSAQQNEPAVQAS